MNWDWLVVGEPRSMALDAQGPYLTYAYLICYGVLAMSCACITFSLWLRRGFVVALIPRRELWVFGALIGVLGLRYMSVIVTLFVGVYWIDVLVLAFSAAVAAGAAWVTAARLLLGGGQSNG